MPRRGQVSERLKYAIVDVVRAWLGHDESIMRRTPTVTLTPSGWPKLAKCWRPCAAGVGKERL